MIAFTYILFSDQLQRFYIGSTTMPVEQRLEKHLARHAGFTSRAKDWRIVHTEAYHSLEEAKQRESQLKGWKSSQRIRELIKRSSTE